MYPEPTLPRCARNGVDLLGSAAGPAVPSMGVLEAHEGARGQVDVLRPHRLRDLLWRRETPRGLDRPHLHAADERRAGHLVIIDVGVEVEDDLLSGLRLGE